MGNFYGNNASTNDDSHDLSISDTIVMYARLINMGFPDELSLKAANKYQSNINEAINWITKETKDNEMWQQNINNVDEAKHNDDISDIVTICTDCISCNVKQCESLKRIISILTFYQKNCNNNYQELAAYLLNYKHLLNDYHHILDSHLNEDDMNKNSSNGQFELIYDEIINKNNSNIRCDINKCKIYLRSNRIREQESIKCDDQHLSIYIDILDTIHCYFMHSIDMGYRITSNSYTHSHSDTDNIANLRSYLLNKRQNMETIRGINRFSNNKFMTQIANDAVTDNENENKDKDEYESESEKKDNNACSTDIIYSFGVELNYWNRSSLDYVKVKHESFKSELIEKKIFSVDLFDEIYKKALILINDSDKVKQIKSIMEASSYNIKPGIPLKVENIMAVKLYTDFDSLQHDFTKSFRSIKPKESKESIMKRNSEYWWWSKILIETVNCFGTKMDESKISTFYHGVSKVYFYSFTASFNSPTSTTTKLSIAAIFAKNDGIILGLKKYSSDLRYFNCSFMSCFGNEDERLFVHGDMYQLQLSSIYNMSTDENYINFIDVINTLEQIVNGYKVANVSLDQQQIIVNLLCFALTKQNVANYPEYILTTFIHWRDRRKSIELNLKHFQKYSLLCPIFLYSDSDKNVDNILQFDTINLIFPNVISIQCVSTGIIEKSQLKALLQIMQNISMKTKHPSLQKVVLNQVKISKNDDLNLYGYKDLFKKQYWSIFGLHNTLTVTHKDSCDYWHDF